MAKHSEEHHQDHHEELLGTLRARFERHRQRHPGLKWADVQARLETRSEKRRALGAMEDTGGEPDVVAYDQNTGEFIFYDCSAESPRGHRSLCYDREALNSRKEAKPASSALDAARGMGIELLTEEQYRALQQLGTFALKTSSGLHTPPEIRALGGAIFADRRYDHVFVYHNGASSYYAARGFRGALRV